MATQVSHNAPAILDAFNLMPPRDAGRGRGIKSSGAIGVVSWDGASVRVDGGFVFALAVEPLFLDLAFDQLDRYQIAWSVASGESFIYYYSGLISGYETLSLGMNAFEPAVCNDYRLRGNNTILVYLKSNIPTYRLQSDRFAIEYTLIDRKTLGIKAFGYGINTNSIQIIVGRWR